MVGWFKAVMIVIGLGMVMVGVSVTDDTSLWVSSALAFPGLALMYVFGVVMETERDY